MAQIQTCKCYCNIHILHCLAFYNSICAKIKIIQITCRTNCNWHSTFNTHYRLVIIMVRLNLKRHNKNVNLAHSVRWTASSPHLGGLLRKLYRQSALPSQSVTQALSIMNLSLHTGAVMSKSYIACVVLSLIFCGTTVVSLWWRSTICHL